MFKKPKYFGSYTGPSYSSYDQDYAMGFSSLEDAKHVFRSFHSGSAYYDEYKRTPEGFYVPWEMRSYARTPATTTEDFMYLYGAEEVDFCRGMYSHQDGSDLRLVWGPRGGVKVDR